jgi:hypothetical protein
MRNGCAVVVVFGVPVDGRRGAPSPPANQTIDVLIGNREKQKKEGRRGGGEGMENGRVTRSLSSHVLHNQIEKGSRCC